MFNNFTYHNTVKLIFGKGSIDQLAKNLEPYHKIMLTYGGGSIMKNGVYDQVKKQLEGKSVVEFGGIEANPTYETLMKGVEIAKEENVDFLLAVGGGSVLDGTKFMAAAIPYTGSDAWNDIVIPRTKFSEATALGSVLTLPATGSEMNYYAVISKKETNQKMAMGAPLLYPKFSILDPETTYSLPKSQVANGLADAFTHVMEQYMTYPVGAMIQDGFAETILRTLIEVAPKTLANPTDYEARSNFMWAATVALNGWINNGVPTDWSTHQIGHELTAIHGIDHARSLAIVMPYLFELKRENKGAKLIQYAKNVWNLSGTDKELIDQAIAKTASYYESLGIPTKASEYKDFSEKTIKEVSSRLGSRGMKFGENADIGTKEVEEILKMSLAS
ncbi:NADP-dependent alcohol dehydrogenase [Spirosomataceae bacterium TFI 002]|nr:NADP-dependent alcohol dehydrogenase [Spirosomataceae bacterium TFI 002]